MSDNDGTPLMGIVSADETYVGGKPRNPGQAKAKMPAVALVEKGGRARSRVQLDVTRETLHAQIRANVHPSSTIMTDDAAAYKGIGKHFAGGHSQ